MCVKLHYMHPYRESWSLTINGHTYHGFFSKEQAEYAAEEFQ